jgi:hypothetical protein
MERPGTKRLNCGRRPDPGRRRQAEECSGRLTVRGWLAGEAPADVGPVDLVATRPHFGGERRWFACPGCGRRCGVLYQPGPGDAWRCLRCHGLTYRSAQQAHREERIHVALERIVRHLEANGGWGDPESLFAGLTIAGRLAMCQALLYLDLWDLEALAAEVDEATPDRS